MSTHELHENQHYIGGAWRDSHGGDPIPVIDARTGDVMGSAPAGATDDLDAAVEAAAAAQPAWRALSPQQRGNYLRALADGLDNRREEIATVISREVGATYSLSYNVQAAVPSHSLRTAAAIAESYPFSEEIDNSIVVREPIGVVGAITAWNFPLHLVTVKAAYAMAAGNTVVVKPSEFAPLSARILAEVAIEADLPAGVLNIVFGTGPIVGEALVLHPAVGAVTFTGSTRAGKRISELAADQVKKVTLELGGKSPNIVLDDADFKAAVEFCVTDCMVNNGQRCDALTRLLVPRARVAEAEQIVAAKVRELVVGDPLEEGVDVGPVISDIQWKRVQELIQSGVDEGARVVVGGPGLPHLPQHLRSGYFVKPTVFGDVTPDMRIAQEEIFGPVLVIQAYDSEAEAIDLANNTIYGLHACIWSGDEDHAMDVAAKVDAGLVKINDGPLNLLAPYGGYKQSGLGREYGRYGFEEFLEVKAITTTRNVRPWS